MMAPIAEEWSRVLALTLFHFLWQGAALGLAAAILSVMFSRRKDARAWHVSQVAMLLTMLACPMVTSIVLSPGAGSTAILPLRAQDTPGAPIANTAPLVSNSQSTPESYAPVSGTSAAEAQSEPTPPRAAQGRIEVSPLPSSPMIRPGARPEWGPAARYVSMGYIAGVLLMFARVLLGVRGGWRLRRASVGVESAELLRSLKVKAAELGLRVAPALAYCARVGVPTVAGILRPMILLPVHLQTGFSIAQVELILLHELAHIRRHDHLINLVQRVAEALLFFHPAVWYVSRQIAIAREHCCDDVVLRAGGRPSDYARILLEASEFASNGSPIAALTAVDKPSRLRRRIARILDTDLPVKLGRAGVAAMVSALLIGVLGIGVLAAQQRSSDDGKAAESKSPATQETSDRTAAAQAKPHETPPSAEFRPELIQELVNSKDAWLRKVAAQQAGASKDTRYLPYLIEVLSKADENSEVRIAAASALGDIGDKRAVPYLVAALRGPDPDSPRVVTGAPKPSIPDAAAEALARISDPFVMQFLDIAIKDQTASVRMGAYTALGAIGTDPAVDRLIKIGFMEPDNDTRIRVFFQILKKLSARRDIMPALEAALASPEVKIAQGALLTLCGLPETEAVRKVYLTAIETQQVPLSGGVAGIFARSKPKDAELIAAIGKQLVEGKLRDASPEDLASLSNAMIALHQVPTDDAGKARFYALARNYPVAATFKAAAVEPLIEALENENKNRGLYNFRNTEQLKEAITALGGLGDPRALSALEPFANDKNLWAETLKAIQTIGGAEGAAALERCLVAQDAGVRLQAAYRLGEMKAVSSVPALIRSLADGEPGVVQNAAGALAQIKAKEAIPALQILLSTPESKTREIVIYALGSIGGKDALAALIPLLRDPAEGVRVRVAEALGRTGDASAVEPLLDALDLDQIQIDNQGLMNINRGGLNGTISNALHTLGADSDTLIRERAKRHAEKKANATGAAGSPAKRIEGFDRLLPAPQRR